MALLTDRDLLQHFIVDPHALAIGDDAFDPRTRRGVLATAPLWFGPERRAPAKAAVLFLGRNRGEALALDARFRKRFER